MTAPAPDDQAPGSPNQYHLHGGGISVTWYPQGAGPVVEGRGRTGFSYQDANRSLVFGTEQVQVEDSALGQVVTVVIVPTVDVGNTTFSLVVPAVVPPGDAGASLVVPVETIGITTVNRLFALAIGHPQRANYSVTHLRGTAGAGKLPMLATA